MHHFNLNHTFVHVLVGLTGSETRLEDKDVGNQTGGTRGTRDTRSRVLEKVEITDGSAELAGI